jgi:hypothetical protein
MISPHAGLHRVYTARACCAMPINVARAKGNADVPAATGGRLDSA